MNICCRNGKRQKSHEDTDDCESLKVSRAFSVLTFLRRKYVSPLLDRPKNFSITI